MSGSRQIVADAILALGLYSDEYLRAGFDRSTIRDLYAGSLGRRRTVLLGNWKLLHESSGQTPGEAPSVRALRGAMEPDVLRELVRQVIRREVYSVGSKGVPRSSQPTTLPSATRPTGSTCRRAAKGSPRRWPRRARLGTRKLRRSGPGVVRP
jgi:hypothetical protein